MKTVRLFETDVYIGEFQAVVEACMEENGQIKATLNQTAFFPEGGGQPADVGTLGDALVLDVQEKDGVIWHTVSRALEPGSTVTGTLDWNWRFQNMQNHTGEHIVSGIVHRVFGYDNVGFHMGKDAVTVDFNGVISEEELAEIEEAANEVVERNVPVEICCPSREELAELDYRSKKEIQGQVRIVTIPGADVCACCGTHTGTTGEVRLIKLLSLQNYKGGVRISMLSGRAAMADYQRKHQYIQEAMHLLSARPEEIGGRIQKLKEETEKLRGALSALRKKTALEKVEAVAPGTPSVCLAEEGFTMNELREIVNQAAKRADLVLGLNRVEDGACQYILTGKADVRGMGKELNQRFEGKGGGSAAMVQGNLKADADAVREWFEGTVVGIG
ncbi:MAG: alanyl-tRNA editing protein [Candidatus Limivivens sp.]|nr:alanyl-tRNA editing protein [Candidatus Limivivens sp.]